MLKDSISTDNLSQDTATVDGDDIINLSGDDESVFDEVTVTSINLTRCKTGKIKTTRVSWTRSASVGYSENINHSELRENLPDLFRNIQKEF